MSDFFFSRFVCPSVPNCLQTIEKFSVSKAHDRIKLKDCKQYHNNTLNIGQEAASDVLTPLVLIIFQFSQKDFARKIFCIIYLSA